MSDQAAIAESIRQLSKRRDEVYSQVCKVDDVNKQKRTCTVTPVNGAAKIYNVRLQSIISGSTGIVVFPKPQTFVVVDFLNAETAYVAAHGEIGKIALANDIVNLKKLIDDHHKLLGDLLQTLQQAQVVTPGGNGPFVPTTIAELVQYTAQLTTLEQQTAQLIEE